MALSASLRVAMFMRSLALLATIQFVFPVLAKPVIIGMHERFGFTHDFRLHYLSVPLVLVSELVLLAVSAAASIALVLTERQTSEKRRFLPRFALRTNLYDGRSWFPLLALGLAIGATLLTVILAIPMALGDIRPALAESGGFGLFKGQLELLALFLTIGFTEEFAIRGYALRAMTDAIGFWGAAFITSALFGLGHYLEGDPLAGAAGTFEGAIFECMAIRYTGSLAFSIGFHTAWDFFESAVYGVPDSSFLFHDAVLHSSVQGATWLTGGTAGPEGSGIRFVVYGAAIAVVWILQRARKKSATGDGLARCTSP